MVEGNGSSCRKNLIFLLVFKLDPPPPLEMVLKGISAYLPICYRRSVKGAEIAMKLYNTYNKVMNLKRTCKCILECLYK